MASFAPAEKAPTGKPLKVGSPHDPAEREADWVADILTAPEEPALPVCTACAAGGAPCAACGGGDGGGVFRRQVVVSEDLKGIPGAPAGANHENEEPPDEGGIRRSLLKPLQAKLTIGQTNDVYEQEADRVAEQVMRKAPPIPPKIQRQLEDVQSEGIQPNSLAEMISPIVQRQKESIVEDPLQAKFETCGEEEQVQRSADGTAQAQPDLERRLKTSQGGGSPLPDEVQGFMEPRFGTDFSQVRIHTDGEAVQMNRELGAQAFTHRSDIYYGAGKAPARDELTVHELTHVVQQTEIRSGNTVHKPIIQRDIDPPPGQSGPLVISGSTFQDAARELATILQQQNHREPAGIVVVNGPNIKIFNEAGEPIVPTLFRFRTPVIIPAGVFRITSESRSLRVILRRADGQYRIGDVAVGRADFSRDIENQADYENALQGAHIIYYVSPTVQSVQPPTEETPPAREELPDFMHFTPTSRANLPAWPAVVEPVPPTSQIASVNSTGSFVMQVIKNQGLTTVERVTNLMEPTNFRWEVLRLDNELKMRDNRTVNRLDGVRAGYTRRLRDLEADARTIRGDRTERQSLPERTIRQEIARQITDRRTILAMTGQTALTVVQALVGDTNTPNIEDYIDIPWNEPGDYFVRCLATPVSAPNAQFSRATSVAGIMVSVFDIAQIARESLPSAHSERASAQERLAQLEQQRNELVVHFSEGDASENSARVNELDMQITYQQELQQAAGNTRATMQAELNFIQAQIEFLTSPNVRDSDQRARLQYLRQRQQEIRATFKGAESRLIHRLGSDLTSTSLMSGVLVDEASGSRKPLTFSIGERSYFNTNQLEVVIADVTDRQGGVFSGRGTGRLDTGRRDAWQEAMVSLRKNLGRGRAWLSYRPPEPYSSLHLDLPNPMQLQMSPIDQARELVDDTAHTATLVALAAALPTGGSSLSILGVLAPIQAGSSLYNTVNKAAYGRLELDAEAVNDFINIASLGMGRVGQAGQFATRGTQILFTSGRVVARLLDKGSYMVMTYQAYQQITANVPGEDPREGRRRCLIALLSFIEGASIPVAGHLWPPGSHRPSPEHPPDRSSDHPPEAASEAFSGSGQRDPADFSSATKGDSRSAPTPSRSQAELEALHAALPPDLTGQVSIVENPNLKGHTVRVYYEGGELRMDIGHKADHYNITAHVQTARVLIRFQGVVGSMRRLADRILTWLRIRPGYGTEGFEARLEVRKLRDILRNLEAHQADIDARARLLNESGLAESQKTVNAITREIVSIQEQITRYESEVDSYLEGRGYVAAEDTTTPAADAPHSPPSAASRTRAEADTIELLAGEYDDAAAQHRQTAQQLKEAGRYVEAEASEGQARDAQLYAELLRKDVARLRGDLQGLSAQQLRERQQLTAARETFRPKFVRLRETNQQLQRELAQARTQLDQRTTDLRRFERNRRTPTTRQYSLSERDYQRELEGLKTAVESAERRVAHRQQTADQAGRELSEAIRQQDRINRNLEDLANLEKGLSEGDNNAKGFFGEAKADDYMASQGYEKLGGHGDSPHGIDGIYRKGKPPIYEYIIIEAKYGESQLGMTDDGLQLSITWCERRIDQAVRYGRTEPEARALAAAIRRSGYQRQVLRYDPQKRRVRSEPPP